MIVHELQKGSAKTFNRLKFNDQGRLYKSPWSPGRHQPLPVNWEVFDEVPWRHNLQRLQDTLRNELVSAPNAAVLQDYLELLRYNTEIDIQTLGAPVQVAELAAAVSLSNFDLHFKLKVAFAEPTVSAAKGRILAFHPGASSDRGAWTGLSALSR